MPRDLKSATQKKQDKEDLSVILSDSIKTSNVKKTRKTDERKKDIQQSEIWSTNVFLSMIFAHFNFKDLLKYSTICKRWNRLINPIIYRSIKLARSRAIQNKIYNSNMSIASKTYAETDECISNIAKHAHLVKELEFSNNYLSERLINIFETFKYITVLNIITMHLSDDQILYILKRLTLLHELYLKVVVVYRNTNNKHNPEMVQLPSTLKKLTLHDICATNDPESFIQTINSHANLIEFNLRSGGQTEFLDPFLKNYPSLKTFKYENSLARNLESLYSVFEHNPQLFSLYLQLQCWNNTLITNINFHLINLEEFTLFDISYYNPDPTTIFLKFSQCSKIKKLNIIWSKLSSCSLESILVNCPDLEDLSLAHYNNPFSINLNISLNLIKPTRIKKLIINCNILTESSFDAFLNNCPCLKVLDIELPREPKQIIKLVGARCINLEQYTISIVKYFNPEELKKFYEYLSSVSNFKGTLTHLSLKGFSFSYSKAEYFDKFTKLKFIAFPDQPKKNIREFNKSNAVNNSWPNFKVRMIDTIINIDVELTKIEM